MQRNNFKKIRRLDPVRDWIGIILNAQEMPARNGTRLVPLISFSCQINRVGFPFDWRTAGKNGFRLPATGLDRFYPSNQAVVVEIDGWKGFSHRWNRLRFAPCEKRHFVIGKSHSRIRNTTSQTGRRNADARPHPHIFFHMDNVIYVQPNKIWNDSSKPLKPCNNNNSTVFRAEWD